MVLSYSNRRELQETCTAGFTFNACANCCGYIFTDDGAIYGAVNGYPGNQNTYGDIKCWDVSLITDMSYLFDSSPLNEPIGCWNVGSVTDMYAMFRGATNFNQPIGNWNVGSVTDMRAMFGDATNFNQPIGNWNVGSVTFMAFMFEDATNFNQNLCAWYNKITSASFDDVFTNSACPITADPDLTSKASFCHTCQTNNGGVQGGTLRCLIDPLIVINHVTVFRFVCDLS
jgi:surface protein